MASPDYDTTGKHAFRALKGDSDVRDIDAGFKALRDDVDNVIATYDQGLLAARPVSTGGSPGIAGRFYRATDDLSGGANGTLYYDYGTGWIALPSGARPPGYEFGYDDLQVPVTVSSTTEASGTTVIGCAPHSFDGGLVLVEFRAPRVSCPASAGLFVSVFEGAAELGVIAAANAAATAAGYDGPMSGELRFTPTAGAHTYTVTATRVASNCTITAGAGGTAAYVPAFVRFTKA